MLSVIILQNLTNKRKINSHKQISKHNLTLLQYSVNGNANRIYWNCRKSCTKLVVITRQVTWLFTTTTCSFTDFHCALHVNIIANIYIYDLFSLFFTRENRQMHVQLKRDKKAREAEVMPSPHYIHTKLRKAMKPLAFCFRSASLKKK